MTLWEGFLFLIFAHSAVHGLPACRDASGNAVDWWIMLKRPKSSAYAYIDSSQPIPTFELNEEADLTAKSGNPLAETVSRVYAEDVWHVAYNDQLWHRTAPGFWTADFKWDESAHAKGLLGFQMAQGFWITHSTPKFPNSPSFYESYTGVDNCNERRTWCGKGRGQLLEGQSFFCATLTATALDTLARGLITIAPIVYSSRLRGSESLFPAVQDLVADSDARAHGASPAFGVSKELALVTAGGVQLLLFVKAPSGGNDSKAIYLYEEVIEPRFMTGFRVQTWRQNGSFPSFCPDKGICPEEFCRASVANSSFETLVINRIYISPTFRWRTGNLADDHSKWVVSGTFWHPDPMEAAGPSQSSTAVDLPRKARTVLASTHPNSTIGNAILGTLGAADVTDRDSNSISSFTRSIHHMEDEQEGLLGVLGIEQRGSSLGLSMKSSPNGGDPSAIVLLEEATPRDAWMSPGAGLYVTAPEHEPAAKVVCFSDVNRAGSQLARGGGAVCFVDHPEVWAAFDRIVAGLGPCGKL